MTCSIDGITPIFLEGLVQRCTYCTLIFLASYYCVPYNRRTIYIFLYKHTICILYQVAKNRNNHITTTTSTSHTRHTSSRSHSHSPYINGISENEVFPGFHPAMEACFLEWDDYQIPGVTYTKDLNPLYHSPFTIFRHADKQNDSVHQVCGFRYYF